MRTSVFVPRGNLHNTLRCYTRLSHFIHHALSFNLLTHQSAYSLKTGLLSIRAVLSSNNLDLLIYVFVHKRPNPKRMLLTDSYHR